MGGHVMMDGWYWGNGYDSGAHLVGGIMMMIFWIVLIVAVVLLAVWLIRQTQTGGGAPPPPGVGGGETPLDVLAKRYARGEIDKAEYEEKKRDLSG